MTEGIAKIESIIFNIYSTIWFLSIIALFVVSKASGNIKIKSILNNIFFFMNLLAFLITLNILLSLWKYPKFTRLLINLFIVLFSIILFMNQRTCKNCGTKNHFVVFKKYCRKCGDLIH